MWQAYSLQFSSIFWFLYGKNTQKRKSISYKDCQLLADACEEQIIQMEKNLEEISPEKYLRYKELHQYFLGIRKLMEARKIKEENAKKEEENFRKQLTESLQNQQ